MVEQINEDKKKQQIFHPSLKEIFGGEKSFRLLIAASSGSGKSQLIKELMTNPAFNLQNKFKSDHVYIICPTLKVDDAYDDITKMLESNSTKDHEFDRHTQLIHTNLEQSLATVYDDIVEKNHAKKQDKVKMENYLIICDDCLLEVDMSSAHSQLARMLVKMRHFQISMIVSTQYLKSCHPIARAQITHFICFQTSNKQEQEKIQHECSANLPKKQFQDLYNFCVGDPHSYMLVIMGFPAKYKYFKGVGPNINQLQL